MNGKGKNGARRFIQEGREGVDGKGYSKTSLQRKMLFDYLTRVIYIYILN